MVERQKHTYRMKIRPVILLAVLWVLFLSEAVRAESRVVDRGGLFSAQESSEMEKLAQELEEEYKMNFLMLTFADAKGMSSAQYAEAFYEEEGYAENGRGGGIVLVIDMDNRQINLVTDKAMIRFITDEREERIYDAAEGYLREKKYGKAMYAMLQKTEEFMEDGIPDGQYTYDSETGKIIYHRSLTPADVLIAFAAAFLLAGGATLGIYRKYTIVKKYEYPVNQNADMNLTGKEDRQVNQFVTKRRIPKDHPAGGGSSGGNRTTTHKSSGGRTYGGGHGRGF